MKKITKISFQLHSYLGLFFGVLYLFFGISGAMLVFKKDIEYFNNPPMHYCVKGSKTISLNQMYHKVSERYPQARQIMLHTFPRNTRDTYEFMIFNYQDKVTDNYLYCCMVDPYTGKIIREGDFGSFESPFFRWLYLAHYSLLIDKPGRLITAIAGLALLLNLIAGVIIYRKKIFATLMFREKLNRKSARTLNSSLHRIIGVWTLLFNFILFFTGFWMNKSLFLPAEWELIPKKEVNYQAKADIDQVIKQAREIPNFRPIAVKIAADKKTDIVVSGEFSNTKNPLYLGKGSDVYYDSDTGKRTKTIRIEEKPFSDRFYWMMKQLHRGDYDNLFVKILYVIAGLSPAVLSITGFFLWKRKGRKKADR
ncbi:PepSY-associated TM helix domain-containing protein [Flavobacterium salmonis]|uniref:Peptidase n=1 Tax=Flavobacterium salmonis TaxID=2654844 RepID=A0A6V6Z6U6_9FLAO|nr:PepSY-associated TM helix domain-containing protein [Flavobacterium salmonis]CAD0006642.1 peptidase [Flavobacterium salmonis]